MMHSTFTFIKSLASSQAAPGTILPYFSSMKIHKAYRAQTGFSFCTSLKHELKIRREISLCTRLRSELITIKKRR